MDRARIASFRLSLAAGGADVELGFEDDMSIGCGRVAHLGFPDRRFLAYMLSVGYPSDKPLAVIERLNRRPFDEVAHRGGW
jgi:nitroreductase